MNYNPQPKKSLGQNFLISQPIINKFISSINPTPKDTVVEIGPGSGSLTFPLSQLVKKVIAIEKDDYLAEILRTKLKEKDITNVEVLNKDFLEIEKLGNVNSETKVISSLPYNVSKPIIYNLLYKHKWFNFGSFIAQKEVVEDYCSEPPNAHFLSRVVNVTSGARELFDIKPSAFKPKPRVHSTAFLLQRREQPLLPIEQATEFLSFTKKLYNYKRKTIKNSYKNAYGENEKVLKFIKKDHLEKKRVEEMFLQDLIIMWKLTP